MRCREIIRNEPERRERFKIIRKALQHIVNVVVHLLDGTVDHLSRKYKYMGSSMVAI